MENMSFWIAQLIGFEAFLLLLVSYRRKNTNQILVVQLLSSLSYAVHYLLLGAFTGLFMCLLDFIRDLLYYKTDKDRLIFFISVPFYILAGYMSFNTLVDILPTVASINDGYSLTKHKKIVLIGAIVSCILWIVYDIKYKSYSGVIDSALIIISNISILLFDKTIHDFPVEPKISNRK